MKGKREEKGERGGRGVAKTKAEEDEDGGKSVYRKMKKRWEPILVISHFVTY